MLGKGLGKGTLNNFNCQSRHAYYENHHLMSSAALRRFVKSKKITDDARRLEAGVKN